MTVGVTQAGASAHARSRARPPATPRRRSPPTPRRRASRRSCSCPAGQVALGKLAQTLAYGARTLLVRGDFDDCLRARGEASAAAGHLARSTRSIRSASRGRRRSCSSCCSSSAGSRPTGSWSPPATSATRRRSARRCARRARSGLIDRAAAAGGGAGARARRRSRASFARGIRAAPPRDGGDRRHRDPHRRSCLLRPRGRAPSARPTASSPTVTDDEILEAKAVVDAAGIGCEPASAASVAGVRELVRARDSSRRMRRVVAVLTGHILKDPGRSCSSTIARWTRRPRAPTGRSRSSPSSRRSNEYWPRPSSPPQRFTIRQIVRLSSAERNSAPSLPSARPTARSFPFASVAKVW